LKKKITLLLIAFLLNILLGLTISWAQSTSTTYVPKIYIYASITYTNSPSNCQSVTGQGVCCFITGNMYYNWSRDPLPSGVGVWNPVFWGTLFPISDPSALQGSWLAFGLNNTYCTNNLESLATGVDLASSYNTYPLGNGSAPINTVARASQIFNLIGTPIGSPVSMDLILHQF